MKKILGLSLVVIVGSLLIAALALGIVVTTDAAVAEGQKIIRTDPDISPWSPDETFFVEEPPKPVNELAMGRVIVRRRSNGDLFSAMVIPMRNIPTETEVKLLKVSYFHFRDLAWEFLVVQ